MLRRAAGLACVMGALSCAPAERGAPPADRQATAESPDTASPVTSDSVDFDGVPIVGTLQPGTDARGDLAEGDVVLRERGGFARAWTLAGRAGQGFIVEMRADPQPDAPGSFDPYLYVTGPALPSPARDDDGGEGCDSRLFFRAPAAGDYRVVATTFRRASGSFTLRATVATRQPPVKPPDAEPCNSPPVDDNEIVDAPVRGTMNVPGEMSDNLESRGRAEGRRPQRAWTFLGTEGATVWVEVLSDEFDPMVFAEGPGMGEQLAAWAAPGSCFAHLSWTLPKTGHYRVVVAADTAGRRGVTQLNYILRLTSVRPAGARCYWLIVPGVRVGPVTAGSSEASLNEETRDVTESNLTLPDGSTRPATLLFADNPFGHARIVWEDPRARSVPALVVIGEEGTMWHTARGVRIGTTLRHLERLNGRPLTVAARETGGRHTVLSWERGELATDLGPHAAVVLGGGNVEALQPGDREALAAGASLTSTLPALRRLDPHVVEIRVTFARP